MTGIIVLAVLALAVIAALELSNRRHSTGLTAGPNGAWVADDRDVARTKLDLLALGGVAEPFNHKPAATAGTVHTIRRARILTHHGRHAA
ncbi:hypothetical protein E1218_02785 [Kribbella turkmenica]|uniref:Uncharacterized protein n=1 Tax=Kribbella turkmenica TaxID=2530375 RepID=A0A4V2YH67_9ACTN|nr:hypothetical protein [Kribbella turkmenica]TDD29887.1 hypothetical protein E1218_02785 [Kribbella turkmenica]